MSTHVRTIEQLEQLHPDEAHIFITEALIHLAKSVKNGSFKAPLSQLNMQAHFNTMADLTINIAKEELDLYARTLQNNPEMQSVKVDLRQGVFGLLQEDPLEEAKEEDNEEDWEEIERRALKDLEENPDEN